MRAAVMSSDNKLTGGFKENLTKEEAIKIQREFQQLDLMLRGYQEESEKQLIKQKNLERDIKGL